MVWAQNNDDREAREACCVLAVRFDDLEANGIRQDGNEMVVENAAALRPVIAFCVLPEGL